MLGSPLTSEPDSPSTSEPEQLPADDCGDWDWTAMEAELRSEGIDPDNLEEDVRTTTHGACEEESTNVEFDGCSFLLMLTDIVPSTGPQNCFTADMFKESKHLVTMTKDQKDQFQLFADTILSGVHDKSQHIPVGHLARARKFADPKSILGKMQTIMKKRRALEPDDRKHLSEEQRTKLYNDWCKNWIDNPSNLQENGLTRLQKQKMNSSKRTSAFNAYLKNTFGGKFWIMALWHEGLSWVPARFFDAPEEHFSVASGSGSSGASEQRSWGASEHRSLDASGCLTEQDYKEMIDSFCMWLVRVVTSWNQFQQDEKTQKAQQKSGRFKGQSGLTESQKEKKGHYQYLFKQRTEAQALDHEAYSHEKWRQSGWEKYPPHPKYKCRAPRRLQAMQWHEQELVERWRSGVLQQEYLAAQREHRSTGASIAKPCGMETL